MEPSGGASSKRVIDADEALRNGDLSRKGGGGEEVTVHDPSAPSGVFHGRDALEDHVRETFRGFPDFSLETDDVLIRGETAMRHGTVTGPFVGACYGAPLTGRTTTLG